MFFCSRYSNCALKESVALGNSCSAGFSVDGLKVIHDAGVEPETSAQEPEQEEYIINNEPPPSNMISSVSADPEEEQSRGIT